MGVEYGQETMLCLKKNKIAWWLAIAGPAAKEWSVRWRDFEDAGRSEANFRVGTSKLGLKGSKGGFGMWSRLTLTLWVSRFQLAMNQWVNESMI